MEQLKRVAGPLICALIWLAPACGPISGVSGADRGVMRPAPLTRPATVENTIIAFDLHDVLFKRNIPRIAWQCARVLPGMLPYLLSYRFWKVAWPIVKEPTIWEEKFKKLTERYSDLIRFEPDFMIMSNAVYPMEDSIKLIKDLKKQGYRLILLSNIGAETYADHARRQPEIMSYFDGIYVPGPDNGYARKPNATYYEGAREYLERLGYGTYQVIFIDDLDENVCGAINCGFSGIRFHSADQLKEDLCALGVGLGGQEI